MPNLTPGTVPVATTDTNLQDSLLIQSGTNMQCNADNFVVGGALSVNDDTTLGGNLVVGGVGIIVPNLPTSDPAVVGQLWNNSGVLTVSAG